MVKNLPGSAGDVHSINGLGRSPGGGNGNPFWYSCMENSRGQRSLWGYSPWDHKKHGVTEHTYMHAQTSQISNILTLVMTT